VGGGKMMCLSQTSEMFTLADYHPNNMIVYVRGFLLASIAFRRPWL